MEKDEKLPHFIMGDLYIVQVLNFIKHNFEVIDHQGNLVDEYKIKEDSKLYKDCLIDFEYNKEFTIVGFLSYDAYGHTITHPEHKTMFLKPGAYLIFSMKKHQEKMNKMFSQYNTTREIEQ